jgi:transposase
MRTRPWEVDDDFWQRVEPLIPAPAVRTKRGRPRVDNRTVFSAILYVLDRYAMECHPQGVVQQQRRPRSLPRMGACGTLPGPCGRPG